MQSYTDKLTRLANDPINLDQVKGGEKCILKNYETQRPRRLTLTR